VELTEKLASFVAEATYERLPHAVVNEAKRTLLKAGANAVLGSRIRLGKT
jgi:hypothetical protein